MNFSDTKSEQTATETSVEEAAFAAAVGEPNGDLPSRVRQLRQEEWCVEDVVDDLRCNALNAAQLARLLKDAGYPTEARVQGIKHLSKGCSHAGGSEIGTLPCYPVRRPRIYGGNDDIRKTSSEGWNAVQLANNPAQFFAFGGVAAQIKSAPHLDAEVEVLSEQKMLHLIGETGDWFKVRESGAEYPARPPKPVADHMARHPHPPLPVLRRLVRTPIFDREGRLAVASGYQADSHMPSIFLCVPVPGNGPALRPALRAGLAAAPRDTTSAAGKCQGPVGRSTLCRSNPMTVSDRAHRKFGRATKS